MTITEQAANADRNACHTLRRNGKARARSNHHSDKGSDSAREIITTKIV